MSVYTTERRKLVVIGDGGCGKTCLLIVFAKNEFPDVHIPTVFETYVSSITVDGQYVDLALWDTAGQEEYHQLRALGYPNTHILIVCFSLDNPDSLENVVKFWVPESRHYLPGIPLILVGTKLDLRSNPRESAFLTQNAAAGRNIAPVTQAEGQLMANRIRAHAYYECSAKTQEGVRQVFEEAARVALLNIRDKPVKKKCVIL